MSLVTMKRLLARAEEKNCAVGAFSVGNMEMVRGAVCAAEQTQTPIVLQIAEKRLQNSPLALMAPMMVSAARESSVEIAVHLDHGLTEDYVARALEYGFTSVMLDASLLPLAENTAITKRVVAIAAAYGATVEAELGVVGGNEGDTAEHKIVCTDPDMAAAFCAQTGVDALAVAIGNAHGSYPVLPALRFDVLEEIAKRLSLPLVLHGGTGMTDAMFRRAVSLGIRKINIATASFDCLAAAAKDYCDGVVRADYFALSDAMAQATCANVRRHIEVFNNQ